MVAESFLKKYDNIIFEPDGVISRGNHFISCIVLAVYEICNSKDYFGKVDLDFSSVYTNRKQISDLILCGGNMLNVFSDLGIDSPVDMAYVLVAGILGIGENHDFNNLYNYFRYTDMHSPDIFEHCSVLLSEVFPEKDCSLGGEIWQDIKKCYYEWMLGDELYEICFEGSFTSKGKSPIIFTENLCYPIVTSKDILQALKKADKNLFLVTLRMSFEINLSLSKWRLSDIFCKQNCITLDDVLDSGHKTNFNMPTEPDPYILARAAIGHDFFENAYLNGEYNDVFKRTLVVSSSPTTLLASLSLGMDFAAVVRFGDKEKRDMFRQLEADYVIEGLADLVKD